jgi:hypothetical protein
MDSPARRRARGVAPLLLGVAGAAACAPPEPPTVSRSQSLARSADGQSLWLAATDADAVLAWRTAPLVVAARAPVGPAPVALAVGSRGVLVTHARTSSLALLPDVASEPLGAVAWISTPCRRTQAVVTDDGAGAWVTCPDEDLLLGLDLDRLEVTAQRTTPRRPTTLARRGRALLLGTVGDGALRLLDLDRLSAGADLAGATLDVQALESAPGVAVNLLDATDASPDGFLSLHQRVEHDADRDRPPERGGYGALVDLRPRIEPRLLGGAVGVELARFDGGPRAASLPAAVAHAPTAGLTWALARGTDSLLVVAGGPSEAPLLPRATPGAPALVAVARVGRGPRGLVLTDDGRGAWVDVALDHALAFVTLPATPSVSDSAATLEPTEVVRWLDAGASPYPRAAEQGRRMFSDATDTRLTPSGVVSCESCHPDGDEDGLRWFLHTRGVPRKLRRTPPAWAAKRALAPYHWDGEFADATQLTRSTVAELMEGSGLALDLSAIAAYMEARPYPPPRPVRGTQARAAWAAGAATFAEQGCARCHPAPTFADGQTHPSPGPSADPDATLARVATPTLRGVGARAPYLHDGRAPNLAAVLEPATAPADHAVADLAARRALITYLESL